METRCDCSLENGRVICVGRDGPGRVQAFCVADHLEQGGRLSRPVDRPGRIEDLVPTMLRVDLREHEKLRIRWVARDGIAARDKCVDKVIDLIRGESEAKLLIGTLKFLSW